MDYNTLSKEDFIQLLEQKDRTIQYLKYELEQLKRAIYGSKSERFIPEVSAEQIDIFGHPPPVEVEEVSPRRAVPVPPKKKKTPVRQKLSPQLKREEQIIEPEVDLTNLRCIGEQVSEKLEVRPVQFYVRKIVRPKYVDEQGNIHIADLPSDPFPKCIAGASVGAQIAVNKYVDHLPLYRQSKIFARQDINLPRSTLNGIIRRGSALLTSLYKKLHQKAMASDYLQADESSLKVLTKDHPDGNIKGCMLVKVAVEEKIAVLEYIRTKEKINLYSSLKTFRGHLQVDGNISYEQLGQLDSIELMHCLVHSRRYFEKALDYHQQKASYVLTLIQELYGIERQAKEQKLDPATVHELRQTQSIPILEKLKEWLEDHAHPDEPTDPLNRAARYMLKRWDGLIKYTSNGKLRPDNNLIENTIRPLALGRKNYLFAGSHQGAEYAAVFYSLFATCKLNGLDPLKWMTDVYQRIQDHPINRIEELLPLKEYQFLDR